MWSYYGAKTNIVHAYPRPVYGKIIEPFAGTARYALKYWDREVLLVDKYEVIVKIWKWLQLCSPGDVLGLPRLKAGGRLEDFPLICDEAALLMGFLINAGVSHPRKQMTTRAASALDFSLRRISRQLFKIRHWKIIHGSYEGIENQKATWFIDPPYQFGGQDYVQSSENIDFAHLAKWSQERQGQAIVCETTKSDWMDFKPMISQKGTAGLQREAIWSNLPTVFDHTQGQLFNMVQC